MRKSHTFSATMVLAILALCLIVFPATAVIQETTVKGTVATVNQLKNTLTIANPQTYGCTYPAVGGPICTWTPMTVSALTSTIPDKAALSVFKPGDSIIGTATGGAYDTWITLAKLYGSRPNEEFVTDIIGDVRSVPTPLVGNYDLDISAAPDCALCSGTSCTAGSSDVTILTNGRVGTEQILTPGQSLQYNGRNDGSSISVTFVKGQALSDTCPQAANGMVGGIQPISDYIVNVVPPIGYGQVDIRTATTTRPDEALTIPPVTTVVRETTTSVPALVPTTATKSGSLPFAVIGSLAVAALAIFARKK
jgi:hypothetical protein